MSAEARMALQPLVDLAKRGMQPRYGQIWIGIDFLPPKFCAVALNSRILPPPEHFKAVAGLDVTVTYHGDEVGYGSLKRICEHLYQAQPRHLMIVDIDVQKYAFLRVPK